MTSNRASCPLSVLHRTVFAGLVFQGHKVRTLAKCVQVQLTRIWLLHLQVICFFLMLEVLFTFIGPKRCHEDEELVENYPCPSEQ